MDGQTVVYMERGLHRTVDNSSPNPNLVMVSCVWRERDEDFWDVCDFVLSGGA